MTLGQYLKEWYRYHSGFGWYNSHLRREDIYCGYWNFERNVA